MKTQKIVNLNDEPQPFLKQLSVMDWLYAFVLMAAAVFAFSKYSQFMDATEYADATTKSLKIIAASQGMLFRVIVADQATGQCRDTSDQASLSVLELPEAQFRLLSSKLAVCVGDESVKFGSSKILIA